MSASRNMVLSSCVNRTCTCTYISMCESISLQAKRTPKYPLALAKLLRVVLSEYLQDEIFLTQLISPLECTVKHGHSVLV
jgi:hypothetical protein